MRESSSAPLEAMLLRREETPSVEPQERAEAADVEFAERVRQMMAHAEMYRLPGDPPLTERDAERYAASAERVAEELSSLDEQSFRNEAEHPGQAAVPLVVDAQKGEPAPLNQKITADIERELGDKDINVRAAALGLITVAPVGARAELLEMALKDEFKYLRQRAIAKVGEIAAASRRRLVETALADGEETVRLEAAKAIGQVPPEDMAGLIAMALGDSSSGVRRWAADCLHQVPDDGEWSQLRQRIVEIAEQWKSGGISDAYLIDQADEDDRQHFMARYPQLFERLRYFATETPLYAGQPKKFVRADFQKDDSSTTLLDAVPGQDDSSLRERVIIRHLKAGPYLAWRKAFESPDFWRAKGFDYVPVEPIVKATSKELHVDVYTRVLNGPNALQWEEKSGLYKQVVDDAMKKIRAAMVELGIKHGHPHEENFIVYFERDEAGKVVLERPPRVYVIDFDMAEQSAA